MSNTEETGNKSTELLNKHGYLFWKCEALHGEIIAIVKGDGFWKDRAADRAKELIKLGKLHAIPIVYTRAELTVLCDQNNVILVHEAKKMGCAILENDPDRGLTN